MLMVSLVLFFLLAETKVVLMFVCLGVLSLETQAQGIQKFYYHLIYVGNSANSKFDSSF